MAKVYLYWWLFDSGHYHVDRNQFANKNPNRGHMCYAEIDSWKRCSSRVKVCRWATIKERKIGFEEKVVHHLSSSAAFVGAPLMTVGIEIPQKRTGGRSWRMRSSSSVILHAVEGERNMEHMVIVSWQVALSAMACRQVSICYCWWGREFLISTATPPWSELLFSIAGRPMP